jgi:TolA-binding protein
MTQSGCQRFHDLWDAYRTQTVSASEIEFIEQHLAACDACRDTYRLVNGAENAIHHMKMDPFAFRRIAIAAADQRRPTIPFKWRMRPPVTAVAVGTVVSLLVFGLMPFVFNPASSEVTAAPDSSGTLSAVLPPLEPTARFEPDGRRILDIFPGTAIYLTEDAILDTIVVMPELTRFALHRGTVVAEIGANTHDYRFLISTRFSEVEARGTLFSVTIEPGGAETVDVVDGMVEVRNAHVPESEILSPGYGLVSSFGAVSHRIVTPKEINRIHRQMSGAPVQRKTRLKRARINALEGAAISKKSKLASQAVKTGRLSEAARLIDEISAAAPQHSDAKRLLAQLARAYRRAKMFGEARRIYLRILDTFPSSSIAADSLVALGQIEYRTLNRPKDALDRFDAYLETHASGFLSETARAEKIRVLQRIGRHHQAISAADAYLQHHPNGFNHVEIRRRKADALSRLGRCAEAVSTFRQIIAKWPGSSESIHAKKGIDFWKK